MQRANITLVNQSSAILKWHSDEFTSSCTWLERQSPKEVAAALMPGQDAVFHARSSGSFGKRETSDCEGNVKFWVEDSWGRKSGIFKFSFDVPLVSSSTGNTYFAESPPSLEWDIIETSPGTQSSVTLTVSDSREYKTIFTPSVHGLRFPNRFDDSDVSVIAVDVPLIGKVQVSNITQGLCGGMCSTALDNYFADQRRPPSQEARVVNGIPYGPKDSNDPLLQYIIRRLKDSFTTENLRKFITYSNTAYPLTNQGVTGWVPEIGQKGLSFQVCYDEWPKIKSQIKSGQPVMVGLCYARSTDPMKSANGHQVVAYRYRQEGNDVIIGIYDPNTDIQDSVKADKVELRFRLVSPRDPVEIQQLSYGFFNDNPEKDHRKVWAIIDSRYAKRTPPWFFSCLNHPGGGLVARRPDTLDYFYQANSLMDLIEPKVLPSTGICHQSVQTAELTFWNHDVIGIRTPEGEPPNAHAPHQRSLAAHARYPEHIDVFWVSSTGAVCSSWWSGITTNKWQAFELPGSGPGSAKNNSEIASVSRRPELIDIFWIGAAGDVRSQWFNGIWQSAFTLPGATHALGNSLSVCSADDEHLCVAWLGSDHRLKTIEWTAQTGWGNICTVPMSERISEQASICIRSRTRRVLDIFWITDEGRVQSSFKAMMSQQWASAFSISSANTAKIDSPLQVIHRFPGHLDVFWVSPGLQIASTWWSQYINDARWNNSFVFSETEGVDTRAPLGVACRTELSIQLVYMGLDGHRKNLAFADATHRAAPPLWRKGI